MVPMQVADKDRWLVVSVLVLAFVVDGAYSSGCGDAEVCEVEGMLSTNSTTGSLVQVFRNSICLSSFASCFVYLLLHAVSIHFFKHFLVCLSLVYQNQENLLRLKKNLYK